MDTADVLYISSIFMPEMKHRETFLVKNSSMSRYERHFISDTIYCKEEEKTVEHKAIQFNIQRFTIHDGPGIRTEIFLKGCPLKCQWCSNPEGQNAFIEPGIYRSKCIGVSKCGDCKGICPVDAISFYRNKICAVNRIKCSNCMACVDECCSEAIKSWGSSITVSEAMEIIKRDKGFYDKSGGGVTVSGGDPLVWADFVQELFKECRKEGIHTCLESTFHFERWVMDKVLPYTDLIISDIKHMNTVIHKKYTGVGNELILENLRRLSEGTVPVILRIPVIPGINDDMKNMKDSADFIINEMHGNVRTLQLLQFMRLGEEKYISLGRPYEMGYIKMYRKRFARQVEKIRDYFVGRGIHCTVGTKEKGEEKNDSSSDA